MRFGPIGISDDEHEGVQGAEPEAANPLKLGSDYSPDKTATVPAATGTDYSSYLKQFQDQAAIQKKKPTGMPVPRVGSAFQDAYSRTGQALGQMPNYGGAPAAAYAGAGAGPHPFGAALQRFQMRG